MQPQAVTVPVSASAHIECKFWTEDDGWKGVCAELSISVHGGSFEEAKKRVEADLQAYVSSVLRDRGAIIAA